MAFIHLYWAKDHVLSWHRKLMDWQHADPVKPGSYNWLIAEDEEGIQGILGYIPTSKYDLLLSANPFTWMALWKIRSEPKNRTVGLRLLNTFSQTSGTGIVAVLGINPSHPPMYKALGYVVGEMNQHFTCDPGRAQTLILAPDGFVPPNPRAGRAAFRTVDTAYLEDSGLMGSKLPRKTPRYFLNRYLRHPVYRYRVSCVELNGRPSGLITTRVAAHGEARVLRIVDFLGDEEVLAECGTALGLLLREERCEYADLFEWGLSSEVLEACGFRRAVHGGEVVVPNYFEPFLQRSARIEFAIKGVKPQDLAIFRGDGDQDRPNRIPPGIETKA
jgi:hypothetical protein